MTDQEKLIRSLPEFEKYKMLHVPDCFGGPRLYFLKGFLSQWYSSPFTAGPSVFGVELQFANAEQFMMAGKAYLFNDEQTFNRILATTNPRLAKDLGRQVKNFEPKAWDAAKFDIVTIGNVLKFTQNKKLAALLKLTHGYSLHEANLYDTVWGIGFDIESPTILRIDPKSFAGQNLLGRSLEFVRNALLEADPRFAEEV
jgi:ribA/ribD-fused uncharacterized protein